MKKLALLGVFFSFLLTACEVIEDENDGAVGNSTCTNQIIEKWDLWSQGTCLRGANIYQQEEFGDPWYPKISDRDFQSLRQAGANYVNLSIPGTFDVKTEVLNQSFENKLDSLVQAAKRNQLYTVISIRTGPGRGEGDITEEGHMDKGLYTKKSSQDAYIEMWKRITQRYKDDQSVVGFDLIVEPHDVSVSKWKVFSQRLVDEIRSIDAHTPLLVQFPDWSDIGSLQNWTPLEGEKIVYPVHQYDPWEYTHESQELENAQAELKEIFGVLEQWMEKMGAKTVINEFGLKHKQKNAAEFIDSELKLIESLGINHAIWIWEVEDSEYDYREFDIRKNKDLLNVVKANWQLNEHWYSPQELRGPASLTTKK